MLEKCEDTCNVGLTWDRLHVFVVVGGLMVLVFLIWVVWLWVVEQC